MKTKTDQAMLARSMKFKKTKHKYLAARLLQNRGSFQTKIRDIFANIKRNKNTRARVWALKMGDRHYTQTDRHTWVCIDSFPRLIRQNDIGKAYNPNYMLFQLICVTNYGFLN